MSKRLYAVGIGFKKQGKAVEYIKTLLLISEKQIYRENYNEVIQSFLTKDDYEKLLDQQVCSDNAVISIMCLSYTPQNNNETCLMTKLICDGKLEEFYFEYRDLIKKHYYWMQSFYGYGHNCKKILRKLRIFTFYNILTKSHTFFILIISILLDL